MNKLLTICLLVATVFTANAQSNNLNLNQIIDLGKCTSYKEFITKATDLGYSFGKKEKIENGKRYYYVKTISANGYDVELGLIYNDYGNKKPFICFVTTQNVSKNYRSEIKSQAEKLNFKEVPCDETCLLFTDGVYKLEIHTTAEKKYLVGISYL